MHITSKRYSSNAEAAAPHGERGITFIEVMVALFLVSIVSILYYSLYIGTMRVNMFLESHNDLTTVGQRSVNRIKDEITQSRTLFQDDTVGRDYVSALAIPAGRPVLPGTLLPLIDSTGTLVPDTSTRRVGNSMLLAREEQPLSLTIDHDGDPGTADVEFLADRYHFEYLYLTRNTDRSLRGLGYYLELIQARSGVYADYFQLSGLPVTTLQAVASDLVAAGITVAWDPGQPANLAFYTIGVGGTLTGPLSHTIALPEVASMMPEFRGGRVEGNMVYSVGVQTDPPLPTSDPVNLFAQASGTFPGGFESLIVGPASSRKALVRLVLVGEYADKINSSVNTVVATTSEF